MTADRQIPFFDYAALFGHDEDKYLEVLREGLRRGAFILQEDVAEFEKALREYVGVRFAFGLADGTNALILGLRAAGIGEGDEIILPAHADVAAAAAIHFVGARPVLADIGADGLADPASIEARVTDRTAALLAVHANGRCCDMDELGRIAARFGIRIFEDATDALGAKYKDRFAGAFGSFGTFSFHPDKTLGCFADGGAIVTSDHEIARRIALMRNSGRNAEGRVVDWGTSCRLDNIQAAILKYKFRTYRWDIARRREIAARYDRALAGLDDIRLPPGPLDDSSRYDIYQNYEIQAGRREALRSYLAEHGVGTKIPWDGRAVHQHRELGFDVTLPVADRYFERCMMLPMNTVLANPDVDRICALVRAFYHVAG